MNYRLKSKFEKIVNSNCKEVPYEGTDISKPNIVQQSAELTTDLLGKFVEWQQKNCKVFPDGWHYKGDAYSTDELVHAFLTEALP